MSLPTHNYHFIFLCVLLFPVSCRVRCVCCLVFCCGGPASLAHMIAAPSDVRDLRKAWMWDDRPGVAKMLNDVADSMAATGFHEEAADLFERCGGGGGPCDASI